MKKRYLMMVGLLGALPIAKAQDTFINDRITATDDLNGTARYVGMGGALGALGADLSVISSNPAGIGLYRKCDVALTFGVVAPQKSNGWNTNDTRTYGEKLARASFDQMGLVWSLKTDGKLKFVNFAFNYQKKANYNQGFYADNMNLGGLSQLDQIAEMVTDNFVSDYNLAGLVKTPDGTCIRDYIYVVDLAKAHVKAMTRVLEGDGEAVEVFNIGTGRGLSTLEVVEGFEKATGVKLPWEYAPRREGDIEKVWGNVDKANRILGWKADTPTEQVLASAWKWQQKLRADGVM